MHANQERFSDINMVVSDGTLRDSPKQHSGKTQFEIANDLYGPVYRVYGPDGHPRFVDRIVIIAGG